MIIWLLYYFSLILVCYLFSKILSNKFIKFFFIPVLFGIFGSFWFIEPGSNEVAPIVSIILLESSILDSNGNNRLLRPMVSFVFVFQIISLVYYFTTKNSKS
tara:strand:- start:1195 stop:1500 length:306 start_codon:yes stop_codon:yes gene_type:complete